MSRPQTLRAALLLVGLAASSPAYAQVNATTPPPKPPEAQAQPTPPAANQPTIDPIVITSTPQPTAATPAPATPPVATPPAAAEPAPADAATASAPGPRAAHMSVGHANTTTEETPVSDVSSPFSVMGVIDHRWNTSASFDLFSDDDVTTFYGVAASLDVLSLTDDIELAVELGWNTGNSHRNGLLGGSITRTELLTHNVQAGISARFNLLPWLAPHARLSGGVSVIDMSLQSQVDDVTFSDHVVAPYLGLGVGASIQTTPRALTTKHGYLSSLRLGARFELGYTLAGTAGFSLHADDDLRVPVTDVSAGGLSRSGPYIHTAAFVRL